MVGDFRNKLLIINFFLLLLFSYGYMQLRIPQARVGLPISEWLILLTLLTVRHERVLGHLRDPGLMFPYSIWLAFGFLNLTWSYHLNGFSAIRDGLPVIESLFLYVGFIVAGNQASLDLLARWFPRILIFTLFYILFYPFQGTLASMSPSVMGMHGQPVHLLFSYPHTEQVLIVASAYAFERHRITNRWWYLLFAATAVALPLWLMPSRSLLLEIAVLVAFLIYSQGVHRLGKLTLVGGGVAVALMVFLSLGLENTRLGIKGLSGYQGLFLEIFSEQDTGQQMTSGFSKRLEWWSIIYEKLTASWDNVLFGLGYGTELFEFHTLTGIATSTPHNSLVNVTARGGVIALVFFVWLNMVLVYRSWMVVRYIRREGRDTSIAVALLFIMLTVLAKSVGEPAFWYPYELVPYYFSAGILLRVWSSYIETGWAYRRVMEPVTS